MQKNISTNSDFHCHTLYSDGENTIQEMIQAAIDIGFDTIAITDHVRKDTKWFPDYIAEIRYLKDMYRNMINVLAGFEAKVLNFSGDLDTKDDWYAMVDIVLGSIHSIPSDNGFLEGEPVNKELTLSCWSKTFTGLMKNKMVTIITHPFSELKAYGVDITEDIEEMFVNLVKNEGKWVEISLRHSVPERALIKKLLDANVKLVIGSDAHSVEELYSYHGQKYNILRWGLLKDEKIES